MQKTELKEDLEKVDIATFLCQNCTSKEMRGFKNQIVLLRKISKNELTH